MRRYSEEVKGFISKSVRGITVRDLVALVNDEFGLGFTESKMRSFIKNHNLKNGRRGIPSGRPSKVYPDEVKDFIKANHKGVGPKKMAELLNETLGTKYTHSQMKAWYGRYKLNSGVTGRFKPGQVPFNKGMKGIGGWEPTQFKKGHKSINYRPVGSERINVDGYTEVKVADPNKWRLKHQVVWEQVNGPIPKGHAVIFGDRNKLNVEPGNLLIVSRAQLVRLNQKNLIQNDVELTKTGIIVADIFNKIGERRKSKRKYQGA